MLLLLMFSDIWYCCLCSLPCIINVCISCIMPSTSVLLLSFMGYCYLSCLYFMSSTSLLCCLFSLYFNINIVCAVCVITFVFIVSRPLLHCYYCLWSLYNAYYLILYQLLLICARLHHPIVLCYLFVSLSSSYTNNSLLLICVCLHPIPIVHCYLPVFILYQ